MRDAHQTSTVQYATAPDLTRLDTMIPSDPGIEIFVREITGPETRGGVPPLLLLHGARASSVASFDLDVDDGSLAADLARRGFPVYLLDARGYGGSTRPPEMEKPPGESDPLTRSEDACRDIAAAVEQIRKKHQRESIAVMGWATGSQWLAHFASENPARASHLVLFNALWPVPGEWPMGDNLEDPDNPGQLQPGALPGYGFATEDALLGRWNASIPVDDPDQWRHPGVARAYARTAVSADPTAFDRSPPSLRTPLGAMVDSFMLSRGHRLFDPCRVSARVLAIRSELDFWSRQVDLEAMKTDLRQAASLDCEVLTNATHFAHLDRPERGRNRLLDLVEGFITSE